MIVSMVSAPIHGKMEDNMRGIGTMVNSTAKVSIIKLTEKREEEDGKKARGWHG